MAAKKKLNFEDSMVRLDEIVSLLEKGDTPLEEAMILFEEGSKLLRECTKQLDEAEQKVMLLTTGKAGELVEEPFQGSD